MTTPKNMSVVNRGIREGRLKGIPFLLIFFLCISFNYPLKIFSEVSAQEIKNIQATRDLEVEGTGEQSNLTIEGDYWALIIGINEYANLPPDKQLQAARQDAQAVADILKKKYDFAKERVRELYDRQATRSSIIKELRIFAKTLNSKDNLFIYYAGHGEYDKETQLGGWIPSDAVLDDPSTFISNEEVRGILRAIKARHIYTVADSCFSESLMGGKTRSISQLSDTAIKELYNDRSRWILTSGGLYPVPDKGKGNHSIFAHYFLRILERNESRYLMPQQIITELQPLVSNESQQTPKSAPIANIGDEGGQFIFMLAYAKVPPPEDLKAKEVDLKFREEQQKRIEEEKARLKEDMRRFKEELERELKEDAKRREQELREKEMKAEQERIAREKEHQRRLEEERYQFEQQRLEEQRRLDQQKKELEKKRQERKEEKPIFMPPAF
ncbi:MAG: caspase family protein [Nitrospinota bacterium]